MTLVRDTSSLYGWHFCTAILKLIHNSKKLQTGHEHYPPYSMFLNTFDLAVTLTFDLRTWLLYATHRLYVVNICAKLFGDQVLGGKVMARTRKRHWRTDGRTDGQTDRRTDRPNKNYMPPKIFFRGHKNSHLLHSTPNCSPVEGPLGVTW